MDCPNCGTWNPDDKANCWRCNTGLPRPEKEQPRRRVNVNTWLWIALLVFALLTLIQQCFVWS